MKLIEAPGSPAPLHQPGGAAHDLDVVVEDHVGIGVAELPGAVARNRDAVVLVGVDLEAAGVVVHPLAVEGQHGDAGRRVHRLADRGDVAVLHLGVGDDARRLRRFLLGERQAGRRAHPLGRPRAGVLSGGAGGGGNLERVEEEAAVARGLGLCGRGFLLLGLRADRRLLRRRRAADGDRQQRRAAEKRSAARAAQTAPFRGSLVHHPHPVPLWTAGAVLAPPASLAAERRICKTPAALRPQPWRRGHGGGHRGVYKCRGNRQKRAAGSSEGRMGYRVAVVGATGNVGREMLNILAEREFPVDEIVALASRKSLGTECSFGDKTLKTLDLDGFDFAGWDIALFAIGSDATKKYAPIAAKAGLRRHRQLVALPLRPGRAADRARGEPRRDRGLRPQEHHRQPQLLDRADGGGAEAAARPRADQARRRRDLPVGLRRRQGGDGRALAADQGHLRPRAGGRAQGLPEADRLQRHPPDRRLHGGRLHQGRVEDGGGDQEDHRSVDQGDGDLRAGAGLRRPLRGGQHRDRGLPRRGGGPRDPARGAGGARRRQARGRRLRDAGRVRRANTRPTSAASARTRPSTTACRCGSSPTTSARAPRSTRCRSPSCSDGGC